MSELGWMVREADSDDVEGRPKSLTQMLFMISGAT
jgi:hypothetical protein